MRPGPALPSIISAITLCCIISLSWTMPSASDTLNVELTGTLVGADGKVRLIDVIRGVPYGLTEAAVEAVRMWTFQPALLEGKPVAVRYILTVKFHLE